MATVLVEYTCPVCKVTRRKVRVPARQDGEPVKQWLDRLVGNLDVDHALASPHCRSVSYDLYLVPQPPEPKPPRPRGKTKSRA